MLLALGMQDPALLEGIIGWARANEWNVDLSVLHHGQLPPASGFDGVLATASNRKIVHWLARLECPVVRMLDAGLPKLARETSHYPMVSCDAEAAGSLGAGHLLSVGRPTFVFCRLSSGSDALATQRGFVRTILKSGREPVVLDFMKDHPKLSRNQAPPRGLVRAWMIAKLRELPLPAAVMTDDDRCALDLMAAASGIGLDIPGDLALLGSHNQRYLLSASTVEISSVDTNLKEVGRTAAELLDSLVRGGRKPSSPLLIPPSRVDTRASTSLYIGPHPGVRRAMTYIREHFARPIRVADVAKVSGLTPRGLQKALLQEAGITLVREITRLRLEAAMQLLDDPGLSLEEVAKRTCLSDAKNLCRLFLTYYGTSPRKWSRGRRRKLEALIAESTDSGSSARAQG
ncbi:substrate-binding domain-containing protein [Luteolibacter ambystomatis]|uniref:Substrate-binding domain-containing protein n=1 Tax=Luteolibacter ambystomatis TaxID=2824561 RepID=A0A975G4U5_9BACT|nr:substrate-binding domain-containing protein [Luteolibacter ambystomatis]QUE49354.1 substrate-binding domain-containing protein [Luteolibacter ambystomatis]